MNRKLLPFKPQSREPRKPRRKPAKILPMPSRVGLERCEPRGKPYHALAFKEKVAHMIRRLYDNGVSEEALNKINLILDMDAPDEGRPQHEQRP